jgi:hypothetical protein
MNVVRILSTNGPLIFIFSDNPFKRLEDDFRLFIPFIRPFLSSFSNVIEVEVLDDQFFIEVGRPAEELAQGVENERASGKVLAVFETNAVTVDHERG